MSVSDSGQRDRRNAEIGGDVVLRNPPDNVGMFFQQFFVTLLWRILDV